MSMALGLTNLGSDERRNAAVREHKQIIDAIRAGNGELASLYMRHHLVQSRERITDSQRDTRGTALRGPQWISGSGTGAVPSRKSKSQPLCACPICSADSRPKPRG